MPHPVLYSFRRCPYAMRARLALKYAGVHVALREIVLRNKPSEMLAISPKGTVPVLQLANGCVLEESLDIMRWALAQSDPQGWLKIDGEACDSLIATNDGAFKQLLDCYKYADRHPQKTPGEWRDEAVGLHIGPLNDRLRKTAWLLGEKVSLADMALMPFVRQFARVDAAWFSTAGFDALHRWLETLTGSALYDAVMQKFPEWKDGDAPTLF